MLLNHSTTSFLFLIRLFFVRDVNEKNIYKYRFVFVKNTERYKECPHSNNAPFLFFLDTAAHTLSCTHTSVDVDSVSGGESSDGLEIMTS